MQDLWDIIKRSNLQGFSVDEGAKIETKGRTSMQ
jgi:hypothetical protein